MVIIILFYNHPRSADGGGLNCGQTTANSRQCGQSSAVCHLGLEGIVSKKMNAPYRSGPSRVWIKVKNPKSPAATRAVDWNVLIRLGTLRRQLEFSVLIPSNWCRNMTRRNKGTRSGGVVLAAVLIGAFTILFAAPLLFLLTHMS